VHLRCRVLIVRSGVSSAATMRKLFLHLFPEIGPRNMISWGKLPGLSVSLECSSGASREAAGWQEMECRVA